MGRVRAVLAILLLVPPTLVGIPAQWLAVRFGWPAARRIPVLYHRYVNAVLGIRRIVRGSEATERPLLLTANHVSWLDITVLSAVMPVSFVAKSEVAGWPLFGLFAKLQRSIFVDRTRRTETGAVNRALAERLTAGDAIVLFAEGTSGDGNRVLPFRTALLGAAREALTGGGHESVWVQPVSIAYVRQHGIPLGRQSRPRIAWYGAVDLAPHLWDILCAGAIDVVVHFGEPILVGPASDRKEIARQAEGDVRRMTVDSLRTAGPAIPPRA